MDSIYKSAGEGTVSKATVGNTLDLNISEGSNGVESGGGPPAGATSGNAQVQGMPITDLLECISSARSPPVIAREASVSDIEVESNGGAIQEATYKASCFMHWGYSHGFGGSQGSFLSLYAPLPLLPSPYECHTADRSAVT